MSVKRTKPLVFLAITVVAALYVLINNVNLNLMYIEGALFYSITISVYVLAWALMRMGTFERVKTESGGPIRFHKTGKFPKAALIILSVLWCIIIVIALLSSVLFNVAAYRDQMPDPEVREFSQDIQQVDIGQVPIVDKALAKNLANKKLGEQNALGSQVVTGDPTIQMIGGKLKWAVPLHHSGFLKWISNSEGTPGYILVSATSDKDVEYVDSYRIKYQPDLYFFDDLDRHVRFGTGLLTGYTGHSFEIDEDGRPYWVVTTYRNKWLFGLPEATGIILVNAENGEMQQYNLDEVPEWVDRVQPEQYLLDQINNKGRYVHGIFNFSNKDKYKASNGESIIYNQGRCYLFTGLTSVSADESAIGFMMVDMVTKQPIRYNITGATEKAAQGSAEGKVQHLKYKASFPQILNVDGIPTYFMPLKDAAGLIKQYSFVSVKNYTIVGVGETAPDALRDYQMALHNGAASPEDPGTPPDTASVTGTVLRIAYDSGAQEPRYRIILEERQDVIYLVEYDRSEEISLTREGDRVRIVAADNGAGVVKAIEFDNLEFAQRTS